MIGIIFQIGVLLLGATIFYQLIKAAVRNGIKEALEEMDLKNNSE